jgi:hypothetical protein
MFKFAERDQVSVAGTYTSVRPVVAGSKGVRLMDAGSKFLTGAVLAESRATLAEPGACSPAAEAALVAILSEARNGLPLPKAKSASSATALPRTLG